MSVTIHVTHAAACHPSRACGFEVCIRRDCHGTILISPPLPPGQPTDSCKIPVYLFAQVAFIPPKTHFMRATRMIWSSEITVIGKHGAPCWIPVFNATLDYECLRDSNTSRQCLNRQPLHKLIIYTVSMTLWVFFFNILVSPNQ